MARRFAIVYQRRPSMATSFLMEFFSLLNSIASARAAFEKVKPDLLVLSIDLAGYDTCAYVKVARTRNRRILLISSIMSIGLDQAEVHYNDSSYHVYGIFRWAVARMFPKWITRHRSRDIFRVPPGRVLAMELLRLSPPRPWLFNSSHADVITMESEAMWDYYGAAGMPASQMVVTGSTADDVMARVQSQARPGREALCRSFGLPADRPILLTALPPDFLDQPGGRPECDFKDYELLADFWLQACGEHCRLQCDRRAASVGPFVRGSQIRALRRARIRAGHGGARSALRRLRREHFIDHPLGDRLRKARRELRRLPLSLHRFHRR